MIIAAVVAVVGSIGAYALVRQRDFVVSHGPAPTAAEPAGRPSRRSASTGHRVGEL